MVTITFIRHGQSEDNPRGIWAGWKDAPLSELGMRQANALGDHLSITKIDLIYSSPLLRARQTGEAVQSGQSIAPALITNPGGESRNDLVARADIAIKECVLPHLTEENFRDGFHIAFTGHGLCIGQLIAALLRYDASADRDISYEGLRNTAWTRVEVSLNSNCGDPTNICPAFVINVTHVDAKEHLKLLAQSALPNIDVPLDDRTKEAVEFLSGRVVPSKE